MFFLLAFAENAIQLVPDGTLFLHVAIILVMVGLLNRTLFKPINRVLAERELQTEGGMSEAQQIVANVRNKIREYEQRLREARNAGYQLMEQQKGQALLERDQRVVALKSEISSWLAAQKSELEAEAEAARRTLGAKTQELGMEIASRVLERPLNPGAR